MAKEEATHVGCYVVDRDDREGKDGPCLGWEGLHSRNSSTPEFVGAFQVSSNTHHAMSKGEVAEGSLPTEEEDGSMRPSKQSIPGQAALGGLSNWVKTLKFSKILLGIPR